MELIREQRTSEERKARTFQPEERRVKIKEGDRPARRGKDPDEELSEKPKIQRFADLDHRNVAKLRTICLPEAGYYGRKTHLTGTVNALESEDGIGRPVVFGCGGQQKAESDAQKFHVEMRQLVMEALKLAAGVIKVGDLGSFVVNAVAGQGPLQER